MIKTISLKLQAPLSVPYVALLRPLDHLFFTIPLVLLGIATAARVEGTIPKSQSILTLLAANILAMSFAFAINEIEDAEDDKKDKTRKNPVSRGLLDRSEALSFTLLVFLSSFVLFLSLGLASTIAGTTMLILSFFYSYKKVRLKSMPLIDLISHGLMLSGLIFLSSFLAISPNLSAAMPIFLGVTAVSIYGQFYNQVRDFKEDKKAKIKNTTALVGLIDARRIMYFVALAGVLLVFYSFYTSLLPFGSLLLTLIAIPVALLFTNHSTKRDLRARIATTNFHTPFLVLVNAFALIFLASVLI
ncbi:prenyltransferase [Candidatus Woesebacteria bacterium]|nr:prenyltransferase [Candidatus Woesebacteria bacterium]